MDIKLRNKEVKQRLSKLFGAKNVSVTNGRGTAWGWCEIFINGGNRLDTTETYTTRECELMNSISQKAKESLSGIEFYGYTDDMGSKQDNCIIQVNLK